MILAETRMQPSGRAQRVAPARVYQQSGKRSTEIRGLRNTCSIAPYIRTDVPEGCTDQQRQRVAHVPSGGLVAIDVIAALHTSSPKPQRLAVSRPASLHLQVWRTDE
jgi:hypothetical protein